MASSRAMWFQPLGGKASDPSRISLPEDERFLEAAGVLMDRSRPHVIDIEDVTAKLYVLYLPTTWGMQEVDPFTQARGPMTKMTSHQFQVRCSQDELGWIGTVKLDQGIVVWHSVPSYGIQLGLFQNNAEYEGKVSHVDITKYERSPELRSRCLAYHGTRCKACKMDFGERYGELASGYIHVHHLAPLSEVKGEHEVDPIQDLVPLCPNCHVVAHMRTPPLSPKEIAEILQDGV